MSDLYEVYALKYAERSDRTRRESFLFADDHDAPHPMDYFVWVIRNEVRTVIVDTGYDAAEGASRGRPVLRDPARVLADFGIDAGDVETVIITHLHYDHAGTLTDFPKALFHLQAAEMAYATGPCMCHDVLRMPFTGGHVCQMVKNVFSGRVIFHEGVGQVAPGIEVHGLGGHSRGLQAVRIKTAGGWLVLASDATHYYENFLTGKVFPIVDQVEVMLQGFKMLPLLAGGFERVIPGHDPLVRTLFPLIHDLNDGTCVHRLDVAPLLDVGEVAGRPQI